MLVHAVGLGHQLGPFQVHGAVLVEKLILHAAADHLANEHHMTAQLDGLPHLTGQEAGAFGDGRGVIENNLKILTDFGVNGLRTS